MRLFLDTEFTQLNHEAKLISIALVDEAGEYFYAELSDTYELSDCSDFVKAFVLPFLKGGDYVMTRYECSQRIGNWIEDHTCHCIIASDNPSWDLPHLNSLLEVLWPVNLSSSTIFPVRIDADVAESIIIEFDYDIHNALDDAQVMKKATLGY